MTTLIEIAKAIFEKAKENPDKGWAEWFDHVEEVKVFSSILTAVAQAERVAREEVGVNWKTPVRKGAGKRELAPEKVVAIFDEFALQITGPGVSKTTARNARQKGLNENVLRQAEETLLFPKAS